MDGAFVGLVTLGVTIAGVGIAWYATGGERARRRGVRDTEMRGRAREAEVAAHHAAAAEHRSRVEAAEQHERERLDGLLRRILEGVEASRPVAVSAVPVPEIPGVVGREMSDGTTHYWVADFKRYQSLMRGGDIYQLPRQRTRWGKAPTPLNRMDVSKLEEVARALGIYE